MGIRNIAMSLHTDRKYPLLLHSGERQVRGDSASLPAPLNYYPSLKEKTMRILLINAPLQSIVCDRGVGHQVPLGLLMIGGPLRDCGHTVRLLDAACDHLSDADIVYAVGIFSADLVMIAHVGSTSAHPCCLRVLRAIKVAYPRTITVYGGVHPTYHDRTILAQHPEVDVIVRGEGEETVTALVDLLAQQASQPDQNWNLSSLPGVSWRKQGEAV